MTIDHVGAILYPEHIVLRVVGRLTFPIFGYLLVLGVKSTRNVRNYFARLFLFALISQAPFCLAFGYKPFETLNIFFTLSFGVIILQNLLLIVPFGIVSLFLDFDFGLYGLATIACIYLLGISTKHGIISLVLLNIVFLPALEIQIFSLCALPLIILHKNGYLRTLGEARGNAPYPSWGRYFYYIYYPLHLTILYLIKSSSS